MVKDIRLGVMHAIRLAVAVALIVLFARTTTEHTTAQAVFCLVFAVVAFNNFSGLTDAIGGVYNERRWEDSDGEDDEEETRA